MLAGRIKGALTYPAFVIVTAIVVLVIMVTVVLPPLMDLFTLLGAQLPWTTRLIIAVVSFLTDYKLYLLGGIVAAIVAVYAYSLTPVGKLAFDKLALRIPLLGRIFLQRTMGQFCRTMAMLIGVGLPLPQIMDIVIGTVSTNRIIIQAFIEVRENMEQGEGLSLPMSKNPLFPQTMVRMIAIGEQTGEVGNALKTLTNYFETLAEQRTQALVSIMEPVLTVVMGLGVAFILLSIITPLYSVLGSIR
jgi:type IV pilus assembly protein PilC